MTDRLLSLLPPFYRQRDERSGGALRRLLQVLDDELAAVEGDVERSYDNWFIETCEERYVPLIGALVGVRPLHAVSDATWSHRAWVANAIAWRRRKGTAAALESLAHDVTGWPAQVVEYFQRVATAWSGLLPARRAPVSLSLRDPSALALSGGPFDLAPRTVDLRSIQRRKGRHNVPNVGIHLWRVPAQQPLRAPARAAADAPDGRYHFDPFGFDAPLMHHPAAPPPGERPVGERAVPAPLRRRPLHDELEALRQAQVDGRTPSARWFGAEPPFRVWVGNTEVDRDQIIIADLVDLDGGANWPRPAATRIYKRASDGVLVNRIVRVAVDPVRGRLSFVAGEVPTNVEVRSSRGFSAPIGGGSYARAKTLSLPGVTPQPATSPEALLAALAAWNATAAPGAAAIIELTGSYAVTAALPEITLPAGARLLLRASDHARPHLRGALIVHGPATPTDAPSALLLDGLLLEGDVTVGSGSLGELAISHCTHARRGASAPTLQVTGAHPDLRLRVTRSVLSSIVVANEIEELALADSILTCSAPSIQAAMSPVRVERCTVLGTCSVRRLEATDSLFTFDVTVERDQEGCVRFCYVTPNSRTPRQYQCAPRRSATTGAALPERPTFTSLRYGDPRFAQLDERCPASIAAGASNGAEMGAFNLLLQPQRDANLASSFDEYLRYGLEAGIFHET